MSVFRRFLRQMRQHAVAIALTAVVTWAALQLVPGGAAPVEAAIAPSSSTVSPALTVAQAPAATNAAPAATDSRHSFVAAAVNQVGAAVVRIDTERTIATGFNDPFANDPFFRNFFGDQFFSQIPQEYQQRGLGSGLIIDNSGIVLTNAHVVSGADTVTVTLRDGRTFQGQVKGVDEPTDLAVVKIDGQNLPIVPLGNSDDVQVGDWAIAVGNPLGLDNTVTLGIVSTLNRSSGSVGIPDKRVDFIQTDAAINPGNSGGPLLNAQGEVIGINTAIRADAQGIGFAVPINTAKAIKDQLARGERIAHPFVGIQMLTLTPETAKQINSNPNAPFTAPEINGVLVMQVVPNSPAASAGLRRGDVITAIDDTTVTTAEQLQSQVERSQIGQALSFTVKRGNRTQSITVRPSDMQDVMRQ